MIKATVSVTKKRPAIEDYSSDMFHASIEIELPETVYTNGNGDLRENLAKMFSQVEAQVDQQISGKSKPVAKAVESKPADSRPKPQPVKPQVNNGSSGGNGHAGSNSYTEPVASSKQVGFLISLAKQEPGGGR